VSSSAADPSQALPFLTSAEWREWLDRHHAEEDDVWVKLAKKGTGIPSVTYDEAVEVALCYGWIDSLARTVDEQWYAQRFTPRRKRSAWSKVNREKASALIEAGLMHPAGLREVERAKEDGRWDA
jgi:uncharacterized protein YdeI (YjbR/CyaY-like superfamily)